jgi:ABC-type polysaccharide/polyol phosphate transport system ATPase subunit
MLKVIAGIIEPPGAKVQVQGRIAPMIELSAGFDGELSGRENIVLSCTLMGLSPIEIADRMESIIDFSEIRDFIEMPFKNYSSGMQARLGFACATAVDPDIILADEVLAVGDANFARKCLNRIAELKARGASVILVSHDASAIRLFCDRAYVFEEGSILYEGDVQAALSVLDVSLNRRSEKAESSAGPRASEIKMENSGSGDFPVLKMSYLFHQSDSSSRVVDVSHPFSIAFSIETQFEENFEGASTFGFSLLSQEGVRICGCEEIFERSALSSKPPGVRHRKISFLFSQGLSELSAGSYRLMAQVRDRDGSRLVFLQELGEARISNSKLGENQAGDIIALIGKVKIKADS